MATEMRPEKIFTSSFWCLIKAPKTGGEYFLWAQLGGHVAKPCKADALEDFLWTLASRENIHHGVFVLAKTPW